MSTNPPRHCHACGSLAVVPSDDPNYDFFAAAKAATAPPPPEPTDSEPDAVEVPEDIEVDHVAQEIKAKPKRRRRT